MMMMMMMMMIGVCYAAPANDDVPAAVDEDKMQANIYWCDLWIGRYWSLYMELYLMIIAVEVGGNMKLILDKHDIQVNTVFCLINAHIPINTQSSIFVVFRLQLVDLYLLLCKGICCGYPFELHRLVYSQHMLL